MSSGVGIVLIALGCALAAWSTAREGRKLGATRMPYFEYRPRTGLYAGGILVSLASLTLALLGMFLLARTVGYPVAFLLYFALLLVSLQLPRFIHNRSS